MAEPSISAAKQKSSLKAVVALLGDFLEGNLDGDLGLGSLLQGKGTVPIALTLLVGADTVREVPGTIDEVHGKKVPRASKEVGVAISVGLLAKLTRQLAGDTSEAYKKVKEEWVPPAEFGNEGIKVLLEYAVRLVNDLTDQGSNMKESLVEAMLRAITRGQWDVLGALLSSTLGCSRTFDWEVVRSGLQVNGEELSLLREQVKLGEKMGAKCCEEALAFYAMLKSMQQGDESPQQTLERVVVKVIVEGGSPPRAAADGGRVEGGLGEARGLRALERADGAGREQPGGRARGSAEGESTNALNTIGEFKEWYGSAEYPPVKALMEGNVVEEHGGGMRMSKPHDVVTIGGLFRGRLPFTARALRKFLWMREHSVKLAAEQQMRTIVLEGLSEVAVNGLLTEWAKRGLPPPTHPECRKVLLGYSLGVSLQAVLRLPGCDTLDGLVRRLEGWTSVLSEHALGASGNSGAGALAEATSMVARELDPVSRRALGPPSRATMLPFLEAVAGEVAARGSGVFEAQDVMQANKVDAAWRRSLRAADQGAAGGAGGRVEPYAPSGWGGSGIGTLTGFGDYAGRGLGRGRGLPPRVGRGQQGQGWYGGGGVQRSAGSGYASFNQQGPWVGQYGAQRLGQQHGQQHQPPGGWGDGQQQVVGRAPVGQGGAGPGGRGQWGPASMQPGGGGGGAGVVYPAGQVNQQGQAGQKRARDPSVHIPGVCTDYRNGVCTRGNSCRFQHI